jgi:hypothetical protein
VRSDEGLGILAEKYRIISQVLCPLCGVRRARRGCPALDKQICAVCCGTKRLVQIQCPSDCTWLASAREHPPAVAVRRQQRDVGVLVQASRDFNERQSQIFLLIASFLLHYAPADLHGVIDDDVAEAVAALASTYETASRGVIYEHRPASLPAERLATELRKVLAEAGKGATSSFDRDAGVVLRRVEEAVRDVRAADHDNSRAFLDLLTRVLPKAPADAPPESGKLVSW